MADEVRAFREKVTELVEHTAFFGPPGIGFETPLEGQAEVVGRLRGEVSRLAGSAQVGFLVTGSLIQTARETGQLTTLNPAASWMTMMQPKAMLGREDIIEAANLAEGRLRSLARQRESEERSMAGKIAALIRFPKHVRELTGYSADSKAGRATTWSVGALMLGVSGSLVASGIWALGTYVF